MFRPLALFIGLRYLRAKQRNHFISFISSATILGVMLGVAVLIVVLSVINGFDREFQNRVLGMVSHANVWGQGGISDWPAVVEELQQAPDVVAAAPFVRLQGMLMLPGNATGVIVMGVDPTLEAKVSILPRHLKDTSLDVLRDGEFNLILGQGIADRLQLLPGDRVTLVVPTPAANASGVLPKFQRFTVAGTFASGADVDEIMAYVAMGDGQHLLQIPDRVHGIRLKVSDLFRADRISNSAVARLDGPYWPIDWTHTHGNLYQSIKMVKSIMALLLITIVVVAAFNIVSSLVMVVNDKRADIAILRTQGASAGTVMAIFMVQGTFVGVVGILLGTTLGITISLTISDMFRWLEEVLHRPLMKQYFVNYMPSDLQADYVMSVIAAAFFISALATIYPAWRAARIMPAEALRYE